MQTRLYLVNKNNEKDIKVVLLNPNFIPRIGEKIMMWYNPYPKVVDVAYDLENLNIYVVIDGPVNK
jgi:hypothetical protein